MMRRLTSSVTVKAPSSFARAFMNTYFLERGPHTKGAELALRFPLPDFVLSGLTIEKRVQVDLEYASAATDGHPLTLSWRPIGNGPLPSFSGTLTATPETEIVSRLTIAGSYAPPGGIAGIVFDQLIGVRIARATMGALLGQFVGAIESDYAAASCPEAPCEEVVKRQEAGFIP